MPAVVQNFMLASPTTHFLRLAQAVLYRSAGLDVVWPQRCARRDRQRFRVYSDRTQEDDGNGARRSRGPSHESSAAASGAREEEQRT